MSFQASATSEALRIRRPTLKLDEGHAAADDDDEDEDADRKARWGWMAIADRVQRVPADAGAPGGQNQPDHERRQRFDPAVAVGMSGVSGRAGHHHAGKDDQRREDIAGELDAGGDDGRGLDGETNGDVERREDGAGAHPDDCEAAAGLEVCLSHGPPV